MGPQSSWKLKREIQENRQPQGRRPQPYIKSPRSLVTLWARLEGVRWEITAGRAELKFQLLPAQKHQNLELKSCQLWGLCRNLALPIAIPERPQLRSKGYVPGLRISPKTKEKVKINLSHAFK